MRVSLLALVAGLFVGIGTADEKKKDAKKDREKLQGTWKAVAGEHGGKVNPNPERDTLTFKGDSFTVHREGRVKYKGTFKIDPARKPKTIDFTITEGPEGIKDKTSPGVYELDGDSLKWACSDPGKEDRPKGVGPTPGTKFMLLTFKREKK